MRPSVLAVCVLCTTGTARAAEDDGAYGRLDGDVTLVGAVGGGVVADDKRGLAHAEVRARYLQAAGAYLGYEESDAFSRAQSQGAFRRAFLAGVELRPLFPVRFLRHDEQGRAFGNLILDSFGIDLGPIFTVRQGVSTTRAGLFVGVGIEIPLFDRASGAWVRFSTTFRWSPERLEGGSDPGGRAVVFLLQLAWHQVVGLHVVDAGDEAPK